MVDHRPCPTCGGADEQDATLRRRERVLTEMVAVQRALARRGPLLAKLNLVSQAVARVLDVEMVAIRLVDREQPDDLVIACSVGLDPGVPRRSQVSGPGVGAAAFRANDIVCAQNYGEHPAAMASYTARGVDSAVAAPVQQFGRAMGSIVAASTTPGGRTFTDADRANLRAFADQASIALTEQHLFEEMQQGYTDPLTGLANRAQLHIGLSAALEFTTEDGSRPAALFVDLDGFKIVNDTLGHAVGDELLVKVSARLRHAVAEPATVGRFGGDEFLVLMPTCRALAEATTVAQQLLDVLTEPFEVSGHIVSITASIGIAWAAQSAAAPNPTTGDLLRRADTAMYRAKVGGRGRYAVFEEHMYDDLVHTLERERDLRTAVEQDALTAHFQPIVDLATAACVGAEALVRWPRDGTLVPPLDFIGIAEETGLIVPLGRQVLRRACTALAGWRQAGFTDLTMSVNFSMRELESPTLVDDVQAALDLADVPANRLVVELTESTLMRDVSAMSRRLTALRELGLRVAIDDFGTGYSSLARLRWLPIDILKIDRSFVDELDIDPLSRSLAATVLQLAEALGHQVVAEGVERESQRDALLEMGCRTGQGYLFARPLPAAEMSALLRIEQTASPAGAPTVVPA